MLINRCKKVYQQNHIFKIKLIVTINTL